MHGGTEVVVAYGLTWLLLLFAVRTAVGHGIHAADAEKLRSLTHLPRLGLVAAVDSGDGDRAARRREAPRPRLAKDAVGRR